MLLKYLSFMLFFTLGVACGTGERAQPVKSSASAVRELPPNIDVQFFNIDCKVTTYANALVNEMAKLHVKVTGGTPDQYAVGVFLSDANSPKSNALIPNVSFNQITYTQPNAGTYGFEFVLRHRASCQAAKNPQVDCELNNKIITQKQSFDVATFFGFIISAGQMGADTSSIGKGGNNFIGKIVSGEGILGTLGKMAMNPAGGSSPLGGILGAGQSQDAAPPPPPACNAKAPG